MRSSSAYKLLLLHHKVPVLSGGGGGIPYTQKVLNTAPANLLAFWPLTETSGTTVDNLEGTAARDGTYGATIDLANAVGPAGVAVPSWDGTTATDRLNVYSTSLRDAFNGAEGSIAVWFKVSAAGVWADSLWRDVFKLRADNNNYVSLVKASTANQMHFYRVGNAIVEQRILTTTSTGWNHLALTWSESAGRVRAYVNGLQEGADMGTLGAWQAVQLAATTCCIGSQFGTAGGQHWSGWLAYAAVWNIELSAAQVAYIAGAT